jgi:7-carboxy-7-deazaguanine synthase
MAERHLLISEVLRTLQGEGSTAGLPCTLVRLAGCPLRCAWCDTVHAREGGERRTCDSLLAQVRAFGQRRVLITGGEPLAQPASVELMAALLEAGHEVVLETSGALDLGGVPPGVRRVVDVKTPSSGEHARARLDDLALLGQTDEVKFVVADRADFEFALEVIASCQLERRVGLLLSPLHGLLEPRTLARWILGSGIDARLNLQLHKLAFGAQGDAGLDPDGSP